MSVALRISRAYASAVVRTHSGVMRKGRRRVVLLPFVAKAAQLHPTTRLPYVTNWLVSWGGIECAWGSEAPGRCSDGGTDRAVG